MTAKWYIFGMDRNLPDNFDYELSILGVTEICLLLLVMEHDGQT